MVLQTQAGGPSVVVIPLATLDIAAGEAMILRGTQPVIFAVAGNATVNGTIDASAATSTPGAGGNYACTTGAAGSGAISGTSSDNIGGNAGGGGGYSTLGSPGLHGHAGDGAHPAGGGVEGNADLIPLRGGCAGGAGGGSAAVAGGASGGAVQLSVAGTLTDSDSRRDHGGRWRRSTFQRSGGRRRRRRQRRCDFPRGRYARDRRRDVQSSCLRRRWRRRCQYDRWRRPERPERQRECRRREPHGWCASPCGRRVTHGQQSWR